MKVREVFRVVTVAVLAVCWVRASATLWDANMDGLQEVPPNASPGYGYALFDVDMNTGNFNYSVWVYDLLSPVTMAHIHRGAVGQNGPVVFWLFHGGTWNNPVTGSGTLTPADLQDLQDGLLYVNIHTQLFPGGEIRGQIYLVPEPGTFAVIGLGMMGLLLSRRRRRL